METYIENIGIDIDNSVKKLNQYRFQTEYQILKTNNNEKDDDNKDNNKDNNIRAKKLENILDSTKKREDNKNEMSDIFKKCDDSIYHLPWRKLQDFHKRHKINEYIKNNIDENLHDKYTKFIQDNFSDIDKNIEYDNTNKQIVTLPINYTNDAFTIIKKKSKK